MAIKKHLRFIKVYIILSLFCFCEHALAQFTVTRSNNYAQLVDSLILSGVTVSNVSFIGNDTACGYFSNGYSTNLALDRGLIISTGDVANIEGLKNSLANHKLLTAGDSLLSQISNNETFDATVLKFNVLPTYDTLSFNLVYGSEEYPEYLNSNFTDPIGVFVTGQNPSGGNYSNNNFALVPDVNIPITVNNINHITNSQYYSSETAQNVVFDGLTVSIPIKIAVVPLSSYQIRIAIADAFDDSYDSGLFVENHSLRSYSALSSTSNLNGLDFFQFSPNPATDKIVFSALTKGKLEIANHLGQLVVVVDILNNQTTIVTENFPSGIYFLTFRSEGRIMTQKLIIQRENR